jgi:hypothetical protein
VTDEVDLRRIEYILFATAHGQDPGLTTWEERVVVKRLVEEMTRNWQAADVLPRTPDPLDMTPTDVMNRYRRWAELERLRLDPAIPWRDGQPLRALLKTCGDRLPVVRAALRAAGIEPPEEWEPS